MDTIIKNGFIVDGTGAPGFYGTIEIEGGRISSISRVDAPAEAPTDRPGLNRDGAGSGPVTSESPGRGEPAPQRIDAGGKVVCPGFIDIHSHNDISLFSTPFSPDKVWQGVTTQTVGHCGLSPAPVSEELLAMRYDEMLTGDTFQWKWRTLAEYLERIDKLALSTNVAAFTGYAPIRLAVMKHASKEPGRQELDRMCALLEQTMREGSFGLTTGIAYPPQGWATTDELIELCRVVADYNGVYATHVRDNIYDVVSGVEEAIEIGRRSGVRVHVAHLQIRPTKEHSIEEVIAAMERGRDEGVEITCDQYPYLGGQGPVTPLFPTWALEGMQEEIRERFSKPEIREKIKKHFNDLTEHYFRWSDIILWSIPNKEMQGKSIQTLAHLREKDPRDVMMDILTEYGSTFTGLFFGKAENDLRTAASWKHAAVGTDGFYSCNPASTHPRSYGTFPRMIRKYVREEKVFSLEEALYRMTALPASILNIDDRGRLIEGARADLLILDSENCSDTATYSDPARAAEGIYCVMVNGAIVRKDGNDYYDKAGVALHFSGRS